MEPGAQIKGESAFVKRAILVSVLLILGALGGLLVSRLFVPNPDKIAFPPFGDERPPIIVQGGSAVISVEYPSETPGKEGKGTWKPAGNGNYFHDHPNDPPNDLRISVFNAKAACSDPDDLRKAKALDITLTDKSAAKSWTFKIKLQGNHVHVMAKDTDFDSSLQNGDTVVVVDGKGASADGTYVSAVAGADGAKGKCEFNADSKPVIRLMQKIF
jgi:hypothetical protein